MKRKQLEEILIILFKARDKDKKIQKASNELYNLIASSTYNPVLDSKVEIGLDIIKVLNPELEDWISYFLYEAPSFYPECNIKDDKGNKYIISSDTDAIIYLLDHYSE